MINVREIEPEDNLQALVEQINRAQWDDRNEMSLYSVDALLAYLRKRDTVFIACFRTSAAGDEFLGMASARLEMKPYDHENWLYIDEIDVCANRRRLGAATAMMNHLLEYAADQGCSEVWLGTEMDNEPAQSLYKSLDPDGIEEFIGYTYEIEETRYA